MANPPVQQSASVRGSQVRQQNHAPHPVAPAGTRHNPPAATQIHRRAMGEFFALLHATLLGNDNAEVLLGPEPIAIGPKTAVRPDLLISGKAKKPNIPLIAVEIQMRGTATRDRIARRLIYKRACIAEYWIVDVNAEVVERWTPGKTCPEICEKTLTWDPPGRPRSTIDLSVLFDRIGGKRGSCNVQRATAGR